MREERSADTAEESFARLVVEGAVEHHMGGVVQYSGAVFAAAGPYAVSALIMYFAPIQICCAVLRVRGYKCSPLDSELRNVTAFAFTEP